MPRVPARRRRALLRNVPASQPGVVEVRAIGPLGDWGRARKAHFKATARPTDRLLPFSDLGR